MEVTMVDFSTTPMGEAEERAKTFASNLMLMHAAYSVSLELGSMPGYSFSWRELQETNPEMLVTLRAIVLIQADQEISC
jgi:hypothetical protein